MHARVFSIQIFQYLRPPRVCTLVLFIAKVLLEIFLKLNCGKYDILVHSETALDDFASFQYGFGRN